MAHPAIPKTDSHIQHGHNAIYHPFAFIVQETKACIGDNPQVFCLDQFFYDFFIIVFNDSNARSLQPALVTTHAMCDLHV